MPVHINGIDEVQVVGSEKLSCTGTGETGEPKVASFCRSSSDSSNFPDSTFTIFGPKVFKIVPLITGSLSNVKFAEVAKVTVYDESVCGLSVQETVADFVTAGFNAVVSQT